jgi:LysR family malonate utilization transcriptional regulator
VKRKQRLSQTGFYYNRWLSKCAQSTHSNKKPHDMQIDDELTLKKLEIFLAFMRTGNLTKAAADLNTSNVSVHRAIHSLESALRCPLFKHEGRNLTPLESAYVLEERAQKLIQDVLATVQLTRQAAGFSAARFRLGSLFAKRHAAAGRRDIAYGICT